MVLAPPGLVLHVRMNENKQDKGIAKWFFWMASHEPYLTSIPCYDKEAQIGCVDNHHCWVLKDELKELPPWPHERTPLPVAILRVCRRVYSETISILYESNTLSFRSNRVIVNLPRVMPPHRFHSIRSVQFDLHCLNDQWVNIGLRGIEAFEYHGCRNLNSLWKPAWSVIASMKGLVKLRVTINALGPLDPVERRNDVFLWLWQPMKGVHVAEYRVDICCNEPLDAMLDVLGSDIPFVLSIVDNRCNPTIRPWPWP